MTNRCNWFAVLSIGILCGLFWPDPGIAQELYLVEDLDTSPPPSGPVTSTGYEFVTFGDAIYFRGCDADGCELWKTDGTEVGTAQVLDLNPGTGSSNPANFAIVGSILYFTATTALEGTELWKSDGTGPGTMLVKDLRPGSSSSSPTLLTPVGSALFFRADDGTNGVELWKSDGTGPGTAMVQDIAAAIASSAPVQISAFGDLALFFASDDTAGYEPWVSDGTVPGTLRLADVNPGSPGSILAYWTGPFALLGGSAYFAALDDEGYALWVTDGTAGGTEKVAQLAGIEPGLRGIGVGALASAVVVAFSYDAGGSSGDVGELWASDGTTLGTSLLAGFQSTVEGGRPLSSLHHHDGSIYLVGSTREQGSELWKTDGTVGGTTLVQDIWPGAASSSLSVHATPIGLLLAAKRGDLGLEPWFSDGTSGGTRLLWDAFPGSLNGGAYLQLGFGAGHVRSSGVRV